MARLCHVEDVALIVITNLAEITLNQLFQEGNISHFYIWINLVLNIPRIDALI